MNYLITGSSLVLFAVFYEMSGGADFTPGMGRDAAAANAIAAQQQADFRDNYVPFDQPIIVADTPEIVAPQPAPNPVGDGFEILQAAVSSSPTSTPAPSVPPPEVRRVSGDRVNMRAGPGTSFDVLATLPQDTKVEILSISDSDWAEVRAVETAEYGWMAAWLLSD